MKKRDKIYDSPEYKQIKEHLPEILKELERDKGLSQYQIPEDWNGDFERIYQKERRKEQIKRRIIAGACAAVILTISAVHIGTHLEFTSVAQADDIGKTRENGFESATLYTSTGISRLRSSSNSVSSNVNVREHSLSVSTPRAPYTLDKPAADKTVIAARVSAPAVFILFFIVTSIPPSTYHPSYRSVSYSSGQTGTS